MTCPVFVESSRWSSQQAYLNNLCESVTGAQVVSAREALPEGALVLGFHDDILALRRAGSKEKPVMVDFVGGKAGHRRKFGGGKGAGYRKGHRLE